MSAMETDINAPPPPAPAGEGSSAAGPSSATSRKPNKRFEIKKWNAVALWAWDIVVDNCAICRNHIMDLCIECQANQASATSEECTVAWELIPARGFKMYLQYYINEKGDKVYTTKKESPLGVPTQSAHPARFSPDDKYSRQRFLLKKRFGLLPTQKPAPKY